MPFTKRQSYMMGTTPPVLSENLPCGGRAIIPWNSQPQVPVGIDWGSPITRGLYAVNHPGFGEILSNKQPTLTGAALSTGPLGKAWTQTTSGTIGSGVFIPKKLLTERTEIIVGFYPTNSSYGYFIGPSNGSSSEVIKSDLYTNKLIWSIHGASWNSSVEVFNGSISGTFFGLPKTIALTWGAAINGGVSRAWVDGIEIVNTVGAYTGSCDRTQSTGQTDFGTKEGAGSQVFLCLSYSRSLSAAEIRSISQNPWQIFKPLTKQIQVPV